MKSPIQITPIDNGWIVAWTSAISKVTDNNQPKQNAVYCSTYEAVCSCLQDVIND